MVDKNTQFYAILTNVGAAKQANADALGIAWKITQMGVGDANGTDPTPNATQKALINEWRRAPLNQLKVDDNDPSIIVAEQVIPADIGGMWIREVGLYDEAGDLVAVANCAPTYKPVLSQGSGRTQVLRMSLVVSSAANVQLKIDPSVVLATREWVTEELARQDFKHSVLAATTGNITLSGLQTVDGIALPAGARVLVKDQSAAKDNGLYLTATGAWSRCADANTSVKVTPNLLVLVERGTINGDSAWQLVTDATISLGVTALAFEMVFGRTGVAPGTYRSVQVDKYGRVVAGTSPTTAAGYGLTDVYTKTQVDDALSKKANLSSPKFTDVPEAPTAEVGTSSNQLATMKALLQGLSAYGLADKSSRPADLDALRGTRFFGFTHWTIGAPAEAGAYDAVGLQIESYGQRTQFAVSGGAKLQIRTDDSEDYSGFSAWGELATVDALSALSNAMDAQLSQKAPLASPKLTGKPEAPTAGKGTNSDQLATTAFVQAAIAALVDSAPGALDSLRELAAALGNDPNFASTILNELAKKANLASPKLTGIPEAPTAAVGTNTDQVATMKALLQGMASLGLTSGRSTFVDDLNALRGTCFFGFGEKSVGAIELGGGYDAIGLQIESIGQRTQFAVPGGTRLFVRTDDSNDASGFEGWVELATVNALAALEALVALKAPLASPKLTGLPEAPTAGKGANTSQVANTAFVQTAVGAVVDSAPSALDTLKKIATALGNDANFADTVTSLLGLKAPLASPKLTGTPEAPTASKGTNTTQLATTAFVQAAVAALIDSAPGALDSLRELATALGNDPNFATTMLNELAKKANLASPKLTGSPEAPTAAVGTNTDQVATMKALLQGLAAFGLSARSAYVGDLDGLRGTTFFGYSNNSLGSEDTGGGYDAVGFQIEGPGQRTQFGVTTASKVAVRTDDSTDYSGFTPWVELATVEALKALEARDVGLVGFFAMPTPPPGWLKRNGAAVSRTTYAALFARIGTIFGAGDGSTTFNLPDARGSFDRGWDDGRNLDKGRAFGSDQGPANLSHVHGTTVSTDGAHVHTSTFTREKITSNFVQEGGNAVFGDQESDGYQTVSTSSGGAHKHSVIIAASGESEARPYNTAYLPCIKY